MFFNNKFGIDVEIYQILKQLGKVFFGTEIFETSKAHVLLQRMKHCLQFLKIDEGLRIYSE